MMYSLTLVCVLVYVCTSNSSVNAASDMCQSKINRHKNMCYWMESTRTDFTIAEERCAASGGNLATIDNEETSLFLKDFFDENGIRGYFWIGYDERNATWNDGTPFSWSKYVFDEPNGGTEYCTMLAYPGAYYGWGDVQCSANKNSGCQIEVPPVSQYKFVGIDMGSTVTEGERVVVVETASRVACGVVCMGDVYCSRFRYIQADRSCTMYNYGSLTKTVDTHGEWFRY